METDTQGGKQATLAQDSSPLVSVTVRLRYRNSSVLLRAANSEAWLCGWGVLLRPIFYSRETYFFTPR